MHLLSVCLSVCLSVSVHEPGKGLLLAAATGGEHWEEERGIGYGCDCSRPWPKDAFLWQAMAQFGFLKIMSGLMYVDVFKLPETNFKFALGAGRCPNHPTEVTHSKRKKWWQKRVYFRKMWKSRNFGTQKSQLWKSQLCRSHRNPK